MEINILHFNPYKIIDQNEKKYIYISPTSAIFEIDEKILLLLECEGKTYNDAFSQLKLYFKKEKFDELLKNMQDALLLKKSSENKSMHKKHDIPSITLMVAQHCNLRCNYCYGVNGEYNNYGKMSLEVAQKAVDFVMKHSGDAEEVGVSFFGGEPLLNFSLIKDTVFYANKKAELYQKKVCFGITCNGTLLTNEITDYIIENNFAVTISIDGDKRIHDRNRF